MEGLQRMAASINYIEKNLEADLHIEHVAAVACMSKFHFQRMFHMLTGVNVAEYIRKRRLTRAAQELMHSERRVIDVAFKYGYETPESFSKAFRKIHGISPSAVRDQNKQLKAFPRLSFQIQLKGDVEMDYRIVEKEEFTIVGKGIRTTTINGENLRRIPAFWDEVNSNGVSEKLEKSYGAKFIYGACMEFDKEQEKLTYFIGVESGRKSSSDWEEKVIPASTWAVFPVIGPIPDTIQKVWERIFAEWFPATGYEHAGGPELEVYPIDGDITAEDHHCEIWIPIVKK
ncbi:AraC family transcriptional regulator [Virgibacillus litoralis]|uniref:AraC family transcriptional regulator n=1 Tax=Virgibacillus litoralis TaxID=578221 RepID=A0ABS4HD77_9BACI|nr:AraC family transcriptional regulator [Virgibacillus litoralis]MBP1948569.1 AraC family transcriptional regulator [Virgibacillus litoralis]